MFLEEDKVLKCPNLEDHNAGTYQKVTFGGDKLGTSNSGLFNSENAPMWLTW